MEGKVWSSLTFICVLLHCKFLPVVKLHSVCISILLGKLILRLIKSILFLFLRFRKLK